MKLIYFILHTMNFRKSYSFLLQLFILLREFQDFLVPKVELHVRTISHLQ